MIPYGRQSIDDSDIAAVVDVLRSDWLTQGPGVERFERAVADYCQASCAVAVSNATAALHLACLALGLGPGKLLWTSPNTFLASANCARYCGADVDFVDVDPRSYCMSIERLEDKLIEARRIGRLPDVVMPVDFAGQCVELSRIRDLAGEYGFKVLEDAAHAVGATYRGGMVGDGRYADITVFSFHPVKIITSGEGGIALTGDQELARRLSVLRNHGMVRDMQHLQRPTDGPWYYEQQALGFNYRITDLQCALGVSQMQRIGDFLARRRALAKRYDRLLGNSGVTIPWQSPEGQSAFHLYPILVPEAAERRRIFEGLHAAGIGVQVHYIPVHQQPYYNALGFRRGQFPEAERYYSRTISLPCYPDLKESEQDFVVETLVNLIH